MPIPAAAPADKPDGGVPDCAAVGAAAANVDNNVDVDVDVDVADVPVEVDAGRSVAL
jgi:hypothetical protein